MRHEAEPENTDGRKQITSSREFVGSLLCTERFSPGTPVSPLLKNQHLT